MKRIKIEQKNIRKETNAENLICKKLIRQKLHLMEPIFNQVPKECLLDVKHFQLLGTLKHA